MITRSYLLSGFRGLIIICKGSLLEVSLELEYTFFEGKLIIIYSHFSLFSGKDFELKMELYLL